MYLLKVLIERTNYAVSDTFFYVADKEINKGCRVKINFNDHDIIGFVFDCSFTN